MRLNGSRMEQYNGRNQVWGMSLTWEQHHRVLGSLKQHEISTSPGVWKAPATGLTYPHLLEFLGKPAHTLLAVKCQFGLWRHQSSLHLWSQDTLYLRVSVPLVIGLGSTITVVLSLWVSTPLWTKTAFPRGCLRPSENTDIYITFHNSRKIAVMK